MRRWLRRSKRPMRDDPTTSEPTAQLTTTRKSFPTGIKVLYEREDSVVDIIFIHGLTGHREKTWTAKGAAQPWPQTLLPLELPHTRILTFGYDAYITDWRGVVSENRIADHAMSLLATLAAYRGRDNTENRPIIFVCHSLGGLVCEDALVTADRRPETHLKSILELTRGILFLGTPHQGSNLAKWAEMLATSIGFLKQTNAQIIEVLKSESEVLARVQDSFHTMIKAKAAGGHKAIEITCFYEELPLPGVGTVVPKHSAILPGYISLGIHSHHMGMTKFELVVDQGFTAIAGELRRWIKELTIPSAPGAERSEQGKQLSVVRAPIDSHRSLAEETTIREAGLGDTMLSHNSNVANSNAANSHLETFIQPTLAHKKTYRIRGIPSEYKKGELRKLLQAILRLGDTHSTVKLMSMAISPDRKTKVATVNFENSPTCLSPDRNEWSFEIPNAKSGDAETENDDDDIILKAPVITIDTHFTGITILRSFKNLSEHRVE
ncbi:hypothetical protein BDZ45DRAFT_227669 [Acephala macrosclerotiorum]|nr:hypothetical protein BDZ45DRAFT_227669 [Acephala macrosclerotiorum]